MYEKMLLVYIPFTTECDNVPTPTEDTNRYVEGSPGHPL